MSAVEVATPVPETRAAKAVPDLRRALAPVLIGAGMIGLAAAFVLAVEKYRQLANPFYVPSCSLSETVDCGSVMRSAQSELFGFPNPLLGVVGFSVLLASGSALATGGRLGRIYWTGLQLGLTAAVVFVHWLAFQTIYRIGAVCPYCVAVWAATIVAFWYVTLHNAQRLPLGPLSRPVELLSRNHTVAVTVWLLAIAALMLVELGGF